MKALHLSTFLGCIVLFICLSCEKDKGPVPCGKKVLTGYTRHIPSNTNKPNVSIDVYFSSDSFRTYHVVAQGKSDQNCRFEICMEEFDSTGLYMLNATDWEWYPTCSRGAKYRGGDTMRVDSWFTDAAYIRSVPIDWPGMTIDWIDLGFTTRSPYVPCLFSAWVWSTGSGPFREGRPVPEGTDVRNYYPKFPAYGYRIYESTGLYQGDTVYHIIDSIYLEPGKYYTYYDLIY